MFMKKTRLWVLLMGLMALLLLGGCGGSSNSDKVANPGGSVGYASHTNANPDGIPKQLIDGVQSMAQADGVTLDLQYADNNANLQLDQVNKMIDDKVSAIVLVAVNGDNIVPAVKRANEAGIPIIATNRDVNGGEFSNVICDERQAGELQANYMAANLPQNAKIVYLKGDMTLTSAKDRYTGFKETMDSKRPDVEIVATSSNGDWTFADGIKNMTLWMTMFPQIDGIAAANDNEALGAMYALKAAGRMNPNVIVCGVDATPAAFEAMAAGEMSMTVKQDVNKIVETVYDMVKQARQGTAPEKGNTLVPMLAVTRDNLSQYK